MKIKLLKLKKNWYQILNKDKNNEIRNLFYGKYQTCITCSNCNKQNFHEDIFNMYILYLNEKQTDATHNQSYQPISKLKSAIILFDHLLFIRWH